MAVGETCFKKEEENEGEEKEGEEGRMEEERKMSMLDSCMLHKLAREMQICTTCLLKCYILVICECMLCCLQVLCKPAAQLMVHQKRQ